MHSTLAIFRHLAAVAPPLVPETLVESIRRALDHFDVHQDASIGELETVMYTYGYQLWPYNQAFKEELVLAEKNVGERFLLPKLSASLHKVYSEFKRTGGTIRDLHTGEAAHVFTSDQRVELCTALVDLQRDIRSYATQHVMSSGKKRYLQRVVYFRDRLATMQRHLEDLKKLADHEDEHPHLADEIRSQVKAFEQGLCLLGPELSYDAVCESVEYFQGRQKQLKNFKHLYQPKIVEYFS